MNISKILIAASLVVPPTCSALAGALQTVSTTTNAHGQSGLTDYAGFPFGSSIYSNSWGSGNALPNYASLAPANLFWNVGSFFTNPGYMAAAQFAAQSLSSAGVVPAGVAQRWEDTFAISQPLSSYPNPPAWLVADQAANFNPSTMPEYQAWVAWVHARPNLEAVANDGGTVGPDFRPWEGTWGYISFPMPLAKGDCQTIGMTKCTYGDWYAYRWAQTSALSGAYGVVLSDGSNMQMSQPSWVYDFNPLLVSAFAKTNGLTITGTTAQQSATIVNNYMPMWNDYLANGYNAFYAAMAKDISSATGKQSLVVGGCSNSPGLDRFYALDWREFHKNGATYPWVKNLLVVCDNITIEPDRDGDNITEGMGGSVINAAREPGIRFGAYLSANDSTYWAAVAQFNPTLDAADQQEWGLKQLKRQWLDFAWAQVGTRQGDARRALAFAWRDHWDAGTVDATTTQLIQTINPVRPFGFALYYSVNVERAVEQTLCANGSCNALGSAYLQVDDLLALRQAVPLNYFVSDASLPTLRPSAYPAGWIVLDAGNKLPQSELAMLNKIAPVFTSAAEAQAYANAPLAFTGGLTGTSFIDQNDRIIITVTNPSTAANAGTINGSIVLRGLPNGNFTLTDLYANTTTPVTVTGGTATIPVSVTRWDTLAFALAR
jgi:hypothetical protein